MGLAKAQFFSVLPNERVQCDLCPHNCILKEGQRGICGVRQNVTGELVSLVYEKAVATHVDPIEKKPLFHVLPGSFSFSIATAGCNFKCSFCQNHDISQIPPDGKIRGEALPAKQVVELAQQHNCKTIACTYTEPTIYFEYAFDIARLAFEKGIKTVFVSNGFINEEPLKKIAPFLAATNIDLKGWDQDFYRKIVGGDLNKVLDALRLYKKLGVFVEVTTLVVPHYVDNEKTLKEIALFIKNDLGVETPWHISRFYPQFKCDHLPPTSISILRRAREIGLEAGLRYVYSGNVPGDIGEHTYCYSCGEKVIERYGFQILKNNLQQGVCANCHTKLDGIWN